LLAGAIQTIFESPELGEHLSARAQALFEESFSHSAYAMSWIRLLGRFGVESTGRQNPA